LPSGEYLFEVCALDLSGNYSVSASVRIEIEGEPWGSEL